MNGILMVVKICGLLGDGLKGGEPPLRSALYHATTMKKEAVGYVPTKVGLRNPEDQTMISIYAK